MPKLLCHGACDFIHQGLGFFQTCTDNILKFARLLASRRTLNTKLCSIETQNSEGATISEHPTGSFTVFLMYSAIRPNTTFEKLEEVLCSREETRRWVGGGVGK
jgi:hypothetical protein